MTKKAFDLASLDTVEACNKPFELELKHPETKQPLGMFIQHVGKDSDVFKQYNQEKNDERLRVIAACEKRGEEVPIVFSEEMERRSIERIVACTTGFRNINNGGPVTFSHAAAIQLYTKFPWILRQVDASIVDLSNFMKD